MESKLWFGDFGYEFACLSKKGHFGEIICVSGAGSFAGPLFGVHFVGCLVCKMVLFARPDAWRHLGVVS